MIVEAEKIFMALIERVASAESGYSERCYCTNTSVNMGNKVLT